MAGVQKQIVINAPAEKIFAYVADIARHSEWSKPEHKLEIKQTSPGPVGQGATFESVGHQLGRNEDKLTVTEYVPNQRVVFEVEGNVGRIRHAFELAPADGGTQVTKSFDMVEGKFPFSFFFPIVAKPFVLPGALEGDLQRIKAKVEGGS
jgi:uncharacterized protein YndB with AHSA1/START domain